MDVDTLLHPPAIAPAPVATSPTVHRKADPLAGQVLADGLRVSAPSDPLEREAEATASRVMRMQAPARAGRAPAGELQRACASCDGQKDKAIHRKPASVQRAPAAIASQGGSGSALPDGVRADLEGRFGGQDFSGVRVHAGPQANTLARSYNARAFTMGSDIYFGQGEYSPSSKGGLHLLAHELTHVVQGGGAEVRRKKMENPRDPKKFNADPGTSSQGSKDYVRIKGCFPVEKGAQLVLFEHTTTDSGTTSTPRPVSAPMPEGSYIQAQWGTRRKFGSETFNFVFRVFTPSTQYPFAFENTHGWIANQDIDHQNAPVEMVREKNEHGDNVKFAHSVKLGAKEQKASRKALKQASTRPKRPLEDLKTQWVVRPKSFDSLYGEAYKDARVKQDVSNDAAKAEHYLARDVMEFGNSEPTTGTGFLANLPGRDPKDKNVRRTGYNEDLLLDGQVFWATKRDAGHPVSRPLYVNNSSEELSFRLRFIYGTPDKKRFGWVNKKCLEPVQADSTSVSSGPPTDPPITPST